MTRESDFDELSGARPPGAEPERPMRAKPRPGLTPRLRDRLGLVRGQRRTGKQRRVFRLAAGMSMSAVFAAGYAAADHKSTESAASPAATLGLKGTLAAPRAHARVEVWHPRAGNWPVTLSVVGLPKSPPRAYYEVFLVRRGKPWASCGRFRVTGPSESLTLTLNAPYGLRRGDSWVVMREISGRDTGTTVLRSL